MHMSHDVNLPDGYRLAFYDKISSTNAEALRLAQGGELSGLWLQAGSQIGGKGRTGRQWRSPSGNLYASLLLHPAVPIARALQLSLLAGIAAHDAIMGLAAGAGKAPDLRLKWPNDILLGGAKIGGVLLETAAQPGGEMPAIIIGTGINLVSAPDELDRPVTSLAANGVSVTPAKAMSALAWATAEWLSLWNCGRAFDNIRSAWLERSQPVGGAISVHIGEDRLSGRFLGIDELGALRMSLASGEERRITAGDVSLGAG
ncbi:MAG: biotin--[acetyl-CoA-carboxylase] ligase [Hyphomicrobiales bacterium]|nr:biotin--[acetyl-CoA-carboxylase] ligase [Hyphomicrobiales bacterium]